jgi:PAS domain S-box-containing protein
VSFRTVDDYALMVAVATAESEVLATHLQRAKHTYWVAGTTSIVLVILASSLSFSRLRRGREAVKRRRAELDLFESEARRASIVESAMDAIVTVDAEHKIVIFNRSAEQVFRCSASEALGQSLDRFIPAPAWAASAARVTALDHGETASVQPIAALRGDGEEFPIEASISQSTSRDRTFYTVIARDITERNDRDQMLRRFRTAMDAASDGIFLIDRASMRFVDVNDSGCRMLGYTREQLLLLGPSAMMTPARGTPAGSRNVR